MKTSLTEQLILGILSEKSEHGYNIEKIIEARDMRKWTDVGFSSIYYVLDKLEKKGLACSKNSKGKEKKQYSITKLGLQILKEETKKRIEERMPANTHLMTGLANSDLLTPLEITQSLMGRRTQLEKDLSIIREKIQKEKKQTLSAVRLFRLSEKLIVTELEWIDEELERINNETEY